jgi:hypothetical protein
LADASYLVPSSGWNGAASGPSPSPANPSVLKLPLRPTPGADGYTLALELLIG